MQSTTYSADVTLAKNTYSILASIKALMPHKKMLNGKSFKDAVKPEPEPAQNYQQIMFVFLTLTLSCIAFIGYMFIVLASTSTPENYLSGPFTLFSISDVLWSLFSTNQFEQCTYIYDTFGLTRLFITNVCHPYIYTIFKNYYMTIYQERINYAMILFINNWPSLFIWLFIEIYFESMWIGWLPMGVIFAILIGRVETFYAPLPTVAAHIFVHIIFSLIALKGYRKTTIFIHMMLNIMLCFISIHYLFSLQSYFDALYQCANVKMQFAIAISANNMTYDVTSCFIPVLSGSAIVALKTLQARCSERVIKFNGNKIKPKQLEKISGLWTQEVAGTTYYMIAFNPLHIWSPSSHRSVYSYAILAMTKVGKPLTNKSGKTVSPNKKVWSNKNILDLMTNFFCKFYFYDDEYNYPLINLIRQQWKDHIIESGNAKRYRKYFESDRFFEIDQIVKKIY
jgi:hypothetical protein